MNDLSANTHSNISSERLNHDLEAEIAKAMGGKTMDDLIAETDASAKVEAAGDDEAPIKLDLKRGRIARIEGDDVYVDLTGVDNKLQGIVPLTQFERPPRLGSIMDFVVDRHDEAEGLIFLSREGAISRTTWDHLHKGSVVEARVVSTNKGGLELELVGGIRAFMPASQIDMRHVDDLESYVGQKLVAMVQEVNQRGRKVLLSRRRHLEHDREMKQRQLWAEIEVGQIRDGVVSSIAEYGVFVDLGGADGLVHIGDLSYSHGAKPADVVKVGDKVSVRVLKLDKEKQRIGLGLKQVAPDPWDGIEDRVRGGDKISGRVLRVAEFGAFVEVEAGVEGLLPISEMSWKRVQNPGDVVKEGDVLHMVVLQVDGGRHRISLSLKQASGDPWTGAERKYPRGSEVEGRIRSITGFGAFVELESGVEGMVHISELSNKHVDTVEDVVKVDETHKFRVLEVDEEKRRIRLSMKPAPELTLSAPAPSAAPAKPVAAAKRKPSRPLKGGIE